MGQFNETLNALKTSERMLMKMCACDHLAIASTFLWTGRTYEKEVFGCATCFSPIYHKPYFEQFLYLVKRLS